MYSIGYPDFLKFELWLRNSVHTMTPLGQAKEIGKIEAKLVSTPLIKKTTSAPAPISPVTARSAGVSAYDTTDPRSTKTMTDSQWIEAERKRQIKKCLYMSSKRHFVKMLVGNIPTML